MSPTRERHCPSPGAAEKGLFFDENLQFIFGGGRCLDLVWNPAFWALGMVPESGPAVCFKRENTIWAGPLFQGQEFGLKIHFAAQLISDVGYLKNLHI